MTENKDKMDIGLPAIEETSESTTGAQPEKPLHGKKTAVIAVIAAVALLVAGGIAWKTRTDRLMAEARSDCAAASERLRTMTNDYNTLLDGQAASTAGTDVKSVKDTKTLDSLSKAMKASTPKTVSCKADSRTGVQEATKAITANASWYKAHRKSLSKAVKAVESSKLDKTVDDAQALYDSTDGKVADDKTREELKQSISKRDAGAIAKAVKAVNDSKAAKEKADAEAKTKAEQEAAAAAAAAAQQQAQASQSYSSGSYSNRNYSYSSGGSPSGGSTYTPPQSTDNGGSSSGGSGSGLHIVIGGSDVPAQNGPSHGEPNM